MTGILVYFSSIHVLGSKWCLLHRTLGANTQCSSLGPTTDSHPLLTQVMLATHRVSKQKKMPVKQPCWHPSKSNSAAAGIPHLWEWLYFQDYQHFTIFSMKLNIIIHFNELHIIIHKDDQTDLMTWNKSYRPGYQLLNQILVKRERSGGRKTKKWTKQKGLTFSGRD